jgi:superfamily II DNA or RNA helicase
MELYQHQEKLLKQNPRRHLLAWGTGTGKTRTVIELANQVNEDTLIVCPKGLKRNWVREIAKWGRPDLMYEVVSKEEFRRDWATIRRHGAVIIDEAHTFGTITSQLHKTMAKYLKKHDVEYRWLLTATPFLRNAWNIYALGKLLGVPWNYFSFREKFFYQRFMGERTFWDSRPGMEDEIATLVAQLGSTVKLEDCIDIPDATFNVERFALTNAQKTAMKKISEVLPIVRFTKYHQICGGTLKGNEYEPTVYIESDKVKRLRELVEENDKLIISCRYNAEIDMLFDAFSATDGIRHSVYRLDGATKDKQAVVDSFNDDESAVLIVNAACSEGWQAPSAQLIVFYSYDFSLKNKIQMEGRIRRIDRPQKVTYLALMCEESIDEAVVAALDRKQDFDTAIYDYELNK